jgi:hypothetical protein
MSIPLQVHQRRTSDWQSFHHMCDEYIDYAFNSLLMSLMNDGLTRSSCHHIETLMSYTSQSTLAFVND